MNKKTILDASALLALLNQEPGHHHVEKVLHHSIMSSVNVSEVVTVLTETGMPSEEAENLTQELISEIVSFDLEQAFIASSLRKDTKPYGLSLGDRACLALAKSYRLPAFTADKIWQKLAIKDLDIVLIR